MRDTQLDQPDTSIREEQLHGRSVFDADGQRLGSVRDVHSTANGQVSELVVRDRWFFGHAVTVPADGIRVEDGDVVLPATVEATHTTAAPTPTRRPGAAPVVAEAEPTEPVAASPAVAMLPSDAVRARYGGLDFFASLSGTLVAFAMIVILGALLAAIADTTTLNLTTGRDTIGNLGMTAVILGYVAIFVAYLAGGWSTGRMARYDGVANGLVLTVWTIVLGAIFGGLGTAFGDRFNVLDTSRLPSVDFGSFDLAGVGALAIAAVVMLVAGAIGGAIGAGWNRRVDSFLRRGIQDGVVIDKR